MNAVQLRGYQLRVIDKASMRTQGVIESPTGSGKTITALELIRRVGHRAVVLVHSQLLARQWGHVIKTILGLKAGQIGDGVWEEGAEITVAMMQTLVARPDQAKLFAQKIGMVVVDECHHAPATTFAKVIGMFPALHRFGFTATPDRGDGLGEIVNRLIGDTIAVVSPHEVQEVGGIVSVVVEAHRTGRTYSNVSPDDKRAYSKLLEAIVTDQGRNQMIARLAMSMNARQTLVLTDRVEHAETLAGQIMGSLLVHGKLPAKERNERMSKMATAKVVVGTKGLLGEGLDCSVWDTLILATPISGETPLLQAVGRVIRPAPGKGKALVIDLVDDHPFTLGMWRKRSAVYRRREWAMHRV
ncbi:MAG: DEAD/DEAH box helicase [Magnetococcales bacterium]|nr:DEAD/DEAH box helicase [Magnetococcales bacterium]